MRTSVLLLLVATSCGGAAVAPPAATTKSAQIVVTVVVDQLPSWMADERLPQLPADGGFARLMREGAWSKNVSFSHAVTTSAAGHAALYTGLPPRDTGVYADDVLEA